MPCIQLSNIGTCINSFVNNTVFEKCSHVKEERVFCQVKLLNDINIFKLKIIIIFFSLSEQIHLCHENRKKDQKLIKQWKITFTVFFFLVGIQESLTSN